MSKETIIALHAEHQGRWKNREEIAERMIALLGQLYREKNIMVSVFGRSLVNRSVIQILKSTPSYSYDGRRTFSCSHFPIA